MRIFAHELDKTHTRTTMAPFVFCGTMVLFNSYWIILALTLGTAISLESTFVIGGLFPLGLKNRNFRLLNGVYPKIAAELAVDDLNAAGLLSAYNISIKLRVADSDCDRDTAVSSYLQLLKGINSNGQHYNFF